MILQPVQPSCSSTLRQKSRTSIVPHAAQFETRRIKVLVKEESNSKATSNSRVLLQGDDKVGFQRGRLNFLPPPLSPFLILHLPKQNPLFTASRKYWMPNGLVEVRKKQPQAAGKKQSKPTRADKSGAGVKKEQDIGPFIILGALVCAVLYHTIPH